MTAAESYAAKQVGTGALAAFRGYERQLQYTLNRMVRPADTDLIFHPESVEDLAIHRPDGSLVEACQVKAYAADLRPSDLRSRESSFFGRGAKLLASNPNIILRIVSFGPVGRELIDAVSGASAARARLAQKLRNDDRLSAEEAVAVIDALQIERVSAEDVESELQAIVESTLVAANPSAGLDGLMWWMFLAAKESRQLTRHDVIQRIEAVGRYLSDATLRELEWFTTIQPISWPSIAEADRDKLADEFYRGVAARPEHVAAELDVRREALLDSLDEALATHPVAVVRGASGSGKTTLALRYLAQVPEGWRFRIRRVDDRAHAARLAESLLGHVRAVGLPLLLWIDVLPQDTAWGDLVSALVEQADIKVLVTVREEDWRRATLPAAAVDYVEIPLRMGQDEARVIYDALAARRLSSTVLDFGDAWLRFGGEGPLLEFVHLVTQSETLRERLTQQASRLEDEVRDGQLGSGELQMLRLGAVASAAEARLDVVALAAHLALPAPMATLRRFEDEYLLRTSADGSILQGLHPIRSQILAELLCDSAFNPWDALAVEALPFVIDPDLEVMLMTAFADRPASRPTVREGALALSVATWTGLAGVTRSLLWLGMADYADRNRALLDELWEQKGEGAMLFLDWDVASASPGGESWIDRLAELVPHGEAIRADAQSATARQTPKEELFTYARAWLGKRHHQPSPPTGSEWSAVGYVAFWAAKLGVDIPVAKWLDGVTVDVDSAPLDAFADASLGLAAFGIRDWPEQRAAVIERFQREAAVLRLDDDGETVTAHFLMAADGSAEAASPCMRSANRPHDETLTRISFLRRLFPNRSFYSTQGYGHRIIPGAPDDTTKRIPRETLVEEWLSGLNGTFAAYIDLWRRPSTWQEVAADQMRRRRVVQAAFESISTALRRYHRSADTKILGSSLDAAVLTEAQPAVGNRMRLPLAGVDPWGLTSEGRAPQSAQADLDTRRALSLDRYRSVLESARRWSQAVEAFLGYATDVLAIAPALARQARTDTDRARISELGKEKGIRPNASAASRLYLNETAQHLRTLQVESSETLGLHLRPFTDPARDRKEVRAYTELAIAWEFFLAFPGRRVEDVVSAARADCQAAAKKVVRELKGARWAEAPDLRVRVPTLNATWCRQPVIPVVLESSNPTDLATMSDEVVQTLGRLLRQGTEYRRNLFAASWPHVVLLWVYGGKLLDRTGIRVATEWFQRPDPPMDPWRFVPAPLPPDFEALGLADVWDTPEADEGRGLVSAVAEVWAYAAHLADLLDIGEVEGIGEAMARDYLTETSAKQSAVLQAAIDSATAIIGRANAAMDADGVTQDLADLTDGMRLLLEQVLPPGHVGVVSQIQLSSVPDWRNSVGEARMTALMIRLLAAKLFVHGEASGPDAA